MQTPVGVPNPNIHDDFPSSSFHHLFFPRSLIGQTSSVLLSARAMEAFEEDSLQQCNNAHRHHRDAVMDNMIHNQNKLLVGQHHLYNGGCSSQ